MGRPPREAWTPERRRATSDRAVRMLEECEKAGVFPKEEMALLLVLRLALEEDAISYEGVRAAQSLLNHIRWRVAIAAQESLKRAKMKYLAVQRSRSKKERAGLASDLAGRLTGDGPT